MKRTIIRNTFVLPIIFLTLLFSVSCGGGGSSVDFLVAGKYALVSGRAFDDCQNGITLRGDAEVNVEIFENAPVGSRINVSTEVITPFALDTGGPVEIPADRVTNDLIEVTQMLILTGGDSVVNYIDLKFLDNDRIEFTQTPHTFPGDVCITTVEAILARVQ